MTALIFLVTAIGMVAALRGYRGLACGLFGASLLASFAWLYHHASDSLKLAF